MDNTTRLQAILDMISKWNYNRQLIDFVGEQIALEDALGGYYKLYLPDTEVDAVLYALGEYLQELRLTTARDLLSTLQIVAIIDSKKEKQALLLRYYFGLSLQECSQALKLDINQTDAMITQALKSLLNFY